MEIIFKDIKSYFAKNNHEVINLKMKMMNRIWVGVGLAATAVAVTPAVRNMVNKKNLNNALSMNQAKNSNSIH